MQTLARFLYSFIDVIFLQVNGPEREYKNLGFGRIVKIVSPTYFEIEALTHTRVPYLFPRQMVVHYVEVELSKTLENIVKLERPKIFVRPPAWLLYSFLARFFLQWVGLEKEYRKQNRGVNIIKIMDKVDTVDKEVEK